MEPIGEQVSYDGDEELFLPRVGLSQPQTLDPGRWILDPRSWTLAPSFQYCHLWPTSTTSGGTGLEHGVLPRAVLTYSLRCALAILSWNTVCYQAGTRSCWSGRTWAAATTAGPASAPVTWPPLLPYMEGLLLFMEASGRLPPAQLGPRSRALPFAAAVYGGSAAVYGGSVCIYGGRASVYGSSASIHAGSASVFAGSAAVYRGSAAVYGGSALISTAKAAVGSGRCLICTGAGSQYSDGSTISPLSYRGHEILPGLLPLSVAPYAPKARTTVLLAAPGTIAWY
eukprot:1435285-Rhodomonas_salina.2